MPCFFFLFTSLFVAVTFFLCFPTEGACVVGLGPKVAGLYSSNAKLRKALEESAYRWNEGIWSMPLEESYRDLMKSKLADLKNISGSKGGGSITAALFLQEFIEKTSHAHIDMAGPVWEKDGPTGYGVKLLVDFLLTVSREDLVLSSSMSSL
jgi:leucyl aminopeptidase